MYSTAYNNDINSKRTSVVILRQGISLGNKKLMCNHWLSEIEWMKLYLIQFMVYFVENQCLIIVCCVIPYYVKHWKVPNQKKQE